MSALASECSAAPALHHWSPRTLTLTLLQLLPYGSSGGIVALHGVAFTIWGLTIRRACLLRPCLLVRWCNLHTRGPATCLLPAGSLATLPAPSLPTVSAISTRLSNPAHWPCSWAGSACTSPIFAEVVPSQLRSLVYSFDRAFEVS